MAAFPLPRRDRLAAAAGTAILQALFAWLLLHGFGRPPAPARPATLKLLGLAPEPPPQREVPRAVRRTHHEGAASLPSLVSRATPVVSPPPLVPLAFPTPIVAAALPGAGSQASAGAATVPGPGAGSGGEGSGSGAGTDGAGNGGDDTPPLWKHGRIKDSDYPRGPAEAGFGGTVTVRYTVETDGRVTNCQVTRSSGNGELDATTCRLVEKRYRYEPSRDPAGRPVAALVEENHSWSVERDPENATPAASRRQ